MALHPSRPLVETEPRPNHRRYFLGFSCLRVACAMALRLTLAGSLQSFCSMLHAQRVAEAFCLKSVVEAEHKVVSLSLFLLKCQARMMSSGRLPHPK